MTRTGVAWWQASAALLFAACPWLAHVALIEDGAGPLRIVLLLLPLVALAYWTIAHARHKLAWLAILMIAAVATWALEHGRSGTGGLAFVYGTPHAAAYLVLLWLFGRTLRPGRDPLVSRIARRVHGALAPEMETYTRRVTLAWCLFFAGQLMLSALLFVFAPLETWSLFVNVLNFPLVALMFAAEYQYRVLRYPDHPRAALLGVLRAFAGDASGRTGTKPL